MGQVQSKTQVQQGDAGKECSNISELVLSLATNQNQSFFPRPKFSEDLHA